MKITAEVIRDLQAVISSHKMTEVNNMLLHILYDVLQFHGRIKSCRIYHTQLKPETITEIEQLGFKISSKPESDKKDCWFFHTFTW